MTKRVSVANAKARLSSLMAEVAFGGEKVIIERRGKPMAVLVSLDLKRSQSNHAKASPEDARGSLARVGAWGSLQDAEAAEILEDIHNQRDGGRAIPGRQV